MSDELSIDSVPAIELDLKRKDHQHLPHVFSNELDSRQPPCPKLGADVIDHGNIEFVELTSQTEVEVGEVNDHCDVRTAALGFTHEPMKQPINSRQVLQYFGKPDHSDIAGVYDHLAASLFHLMSAQAKALQVFLGWSKQVAQSGYEACAVCFAGSLSCRDEKSHDEIMTGSARKPR